jgi:hypothetical protein
MRARIEAWDEQRQHRADHQQQADSRSESAITADHSDFSSFVSMPLEGACRQAAAPVIGQIATHC